jgi:hypothetical protein
MHVIFTLTNHHSPRSSLAAFLGDTNFPDIMVHASKGERILRYQDLYRRYSRLGLSAMRDRPYAIDGLQSRLCRAFNVAGGWGVFDADHLHRSLLWRRGDGVAALDRIAFPAGYGVVAPSWSWMACAGGIDYVSPGFNEVQWAPLRSPWARQSRAVSLEDFPPPLEWEELAIEGAGQDFNLDGALGEEDENSMLVFDRPDEAEGLPDLKCLVLGVKVGSVARGTRRHYVLLLRRAEVAPLGREVDAGSRWHRIGAGYLPERHIAPTKTVVIVC